MKLKAFVLGLAFLVLISSPTIAKTIHVPADSSSIQKGINGAVNGDTVLVAPGTYYEHINFNGKAILVKSEAGAESTIIGKLYDGIPIVSFVSGEKNSSILDGFTVRNAQNPSGSGGGIYCFRNSSPIIQNNNIIGNTAANGGGIACEINSSPLIQNNHIRENTAQAYGGAISCFNSSPTISQNVLTKNMSSSYGAAIFCSWSSSTIDHNVVVENSTTSLGALVCDYSSPLILSNTLDRNNTSWGSITCYNNSSPQIINNIVTNELSSYGIYCVDNSFPNITYCDVWNNKSGNFYGCLPGIGTISANPIFCDTASDNYHLYSLSPCVGTGEGGTDIGAFPAGCEGDLSVQVSPGPDKSGRATTDVSVQFFVNNTGRLTDTYDVKVTDSLGWNITPLQYELTLDFNQLDTAIFTVHIPAVPIGTTDRISVSAISQTDSTIRDSASLKVVCNALIEGVEVTAGTNQSGYGDSIVSITYTVRNTGVVTDSYSVNISDSRGWNIVPTQYNLILDTAQSVPVSFTVTIPYVPLGTVDQVALLAVSKSTPLARDSATLSVTCNAYKEGLDVSPSSNRSGEANSHVTAKFYVQNTGIVKDSCRLTISDSLGWTIQPPSYKVTLNPGQRDSVLFDVSIPSVPVGTTDKITLQGVSLTNPFVKDTTYLLATCSSYNIVIRKISDVGNDQGKQVFIEWLSFPGSDPLVTNFSIFRRKDSLITSSSAESVLGSSRFLKYPPGEWQWLFTIPAYGETLYSAILPTLRDSTKSEGIYWTYFFVRAGTGNPTVFFDSPVDSGYSVDNLKPSPPTGFLALHKPAATKLIWKTSTEIDFKYFTLYRDTTSEFVPSLSNRLTYTIDTSFVDSTAKLGKPCYYLISATDFSGNESNPSEEIMAIRYITGDANSDGLITISDVIRLVNYLFKGGPAPSPLASGNVNCDAGITVSDIVYLINYLFKGGTMPCEPL